MRHTPTRPFPGGIIPIVACGVLLAAGCDQPEPPRVERPRPVKTVTVSAWEDAHTRTFPGRVEASRRVELAFQVPGVIVELPVKEGQEVAQGDLLAQLRTDEFQARLEALKGRLDRARAELQSALAGERPEERLRREADVRSTRAQLANAQTEYGRYARLLPTRAITRADYERAETAYRVAEEAHQAALQMLEKGSIARDEDVQARRADVRGLEAQVVEAQLQLDDCTLRAPFDGVIAQRFVEQGQNVQAKQRVVRFQDVDEVEIIVDVPESVMAADIRTAEVVNMVARITGAPGLEFPAVIREVAQAADPVTQTFQVRVVMEAPEGVRVLPGMTATVTASFRRASVLGNRVLAPASAVTKDPSGRQIAWVLGPEGKVAAREVKLGELTGGQVEVVSGLEPGERIASAGAGFLREGMKVRDLGDALGAASQ
ncbi:Multidrug resistance protein MdtE precursor [Pirellulimonas nuda]|uniref:Multidrug resistance protein MdtE n=1 Tax=Pirellulimonas nuda TaxID=2528009 RepID=A0A518DFU4_9BACT|nr:efflux RND transporter periplasmic adaptor subunit [Pirellulimonas nuda]QDU90357.1 Multidrug resistance protein MdtE precursor [Pirellulimonas nuda]